MTNKRNMKICFTNQINLLCFLAIILFLSNQTLSTKISLTSKTLTSAASITLSGNQWEQIADEVSDTTQIFFEIQLKYYLMAYGFDSKWAIKLVRNSFTCSNDFFGEDPYSGKVKGCFRLKNYVAFKECASEGATCTMSETGNKLVRYGYDDTYNYAYKVYSSNSVSCSKTVFGDPVNGKKKKCWYVVTDA